MPPSPTPLQVVEDQEKIFFGIRAEDSVFEKYQTFLMETEGPAPTAVPDSLATIPTTTR